MAITDARVLRSLRITEEKGDKQTRQYSATEDYLIVSDEPNPSFAAILRNEQDWPNMGNKPLPQIDDEVTLNGVRYYCSRREISYYQNSDRVVIMSVRYDAKDEQDDEQPDPPQGTQPDSWKRITISSTQVTVPAIGFQQKDQIQPKGQNVFEGDPPRNSAGDPVEGLEEETALLRLTYTNTQVVNPNFDQLRDYTNLCNQDTFLGAPPYTVRCTGWSGEYDQKNNVWRISVEFYFNPNGWEITFFDAGYNEIIDGKRVAILDLAGNPVSKPVPLQDGRAKTIAAQGNSSSGQSAVEPTTITFYPYRHTPMSQIWQDCGI